MDEAAPMPSPTPPQRVIPTADDFRASLKAYAEGKISLEELDGLILEADAAPGKPGPELEELLRRADDRIIEYVQPEELGDEGALKADLLKLAQGGPADA